MHIPSSLAVLLLAATQVSAHGAIVRATGDQGGNGSALGIDPNTPRDGTRRDPFQQDSTRFSADRGDAADTCGSTLAAGDNDAEAGTQQVMAQSGDQLPQVSQGGTVMMTLHQVNSDGAGPYTCEVDETGTGAQWTPITVTQNVDGRNSRNRQGSETDHPLTAQLNADTNCQGTVAGQQNVCMVRCMNGANAGPFGGCVPVQQVQAGGAAGAAAPAAGAGAGAADAGAAGAAGGAAGAAGGATDAGAAGGATGADAGATGGAGADAGATGADATDATDADAGATGGATGAAAGGNDNDNDNNRGNRGNQNNNNNNPLGGLLGGNNNNAAGAGAGAADDDDDDA